MEGNVMWTGEATTSCEIAGDFSPNTHGRRRNGIPTLPEPLDCAEVVHLRAQYL